MPKKLRSCSPTLAEAAITLRALADPYRLQIIDLLMQGELGHSDLKEQLNLPPNLLSHHLKILRQAGLIRSRPDKLDARWVYYAIEDEILARWQSWLVKFLDSNRRRTYPPLSGPEAKQHSGVSIQSQRKNWRSKHSVLFLCSGNSCRSQMAEAIINTRLGDKWEAVSAGTQPTGFVHPKVIESLAEIGIDWRGHTSKHADQFQTIPFDLIVTLCDNAKKNYPAWLDQSQPTPVHLGFPDPAKAVGSDEEILSTFRSVRDAITQQLPNLLQNNEEKQ